MKRIIRISALLLLFCLLSALLFTLSTSAASGSPDRLVDDADLLTPGQEDSLRRQLDELSEEYGVDVIIVTTADLRGKSPEAYADDYYDSHFGVNTDGILLLRYKNAYDRYVHLSTSGKGIRVITDMDREYLFDRMQPYCESGNESAAFSVFIRQTRSELDDYLSYNKIWIVIGLALGLIVALIVTGKMKGDLKTVKAQKYAGSYIRPDSLRMTVSRDTFLYSTVSRVRRETSSSSGGSSTHHSSSGGTHGGGGRHM